MSLHSLGDRGTLPKSGKPGDVYYAKGIVYLALADGTITPLQNLHDTFARLGIGAIVGPQGAPGRDGKDGAAGSDGKDGAPGRDGKDGRDGSVLYVGPDEIKAAHQEILKQRAHTLATLADMMQAAANYPAGARQLVLQALKRVKDTIQS